MENPVLSQETQLALSELLLVLRLAGGADGLLKRYTAVDEVSAEVRRLEKEKAHLEKRVDHLEILVRRLEERLFSGPAVQSPKIPPAAVSKFPAQSGFSFVPRNTPSTDTAFKFT
jgi:hypothetical protein